MMDKISFRSQKGEFQRVWIIEIHKQHIIVEYSFSLTHIDGA